MRKARLMFLAEVRLQTINVGRDYGTQIEVLEGLKSGDKVVTAITDELRDGETVKPVTPGMPIRNSRSGSGPVT